MKKYVSTWFRNWLEEDFVKKELKVGDIIEIKNINNFRVKIFRISKKLAIGKTEDNKYYRFSKEFFKQKEEVIEKIKEKGNNNFQDWVFPTNYPNKVPENSIYLVYEK